MLIEVYDIQGSANGFQVSSPYCLDEKGERNVELRTNDFSVR